MICTVSTVKDAPENVSRFVARNLSAGADHMFVFLDAPDPDVEAVLEDQEHVTTVRTDDEYWRGRRPDNLNVRQVVNANLANCLLAPFEWPTWLFHIDGDECLDVDKQWLLDAPASVRSVRLAPLEVVCRAEPTGEVVQFKRLLGRDELALLFTLGLIRSRRNQEYFHGHVRGKSGIRPGLDLKLRVHGVQGRPDDKVEQATGERLRHLHFESYSIDEFVRKWTAHGGPSAATVNRNGLALRSAVHAAVSNPYLTEERRRDYLREIYKRRVEDPVDVLEELGYLVEVRPERRSAVPVALQPDQRGELEELLAKLTGSDKEAFAPERRPAAQVRALHRIHQAPDLSPSLAARIEACLSKADGAGDLALAGSGVGRRRRLDRLRT